MVGRGTRLRLVAAMNPARSSCGVLKQCGTVVRAGAVRPLGKEHEQERGCGEGNGTQNADWQLGRVPRSLGLWFRGDSPLVPAAPTDAAAQRGGSSRTPAPLPRASAAEEQIMCGLLKRCGELPVGEDGLAEFAEGLVAGEHEEKVERPGGCAVA